MRLHSISEAMGHVEYTPPADPRQLIADFYVIQLLSSRPAGTPSHRNDNLSYDVDHVRRVLVPHLREKLLSEAGYAIVCELRHLFDETKITDAGPEHHDNYIWNQLLELGVPTPGIRLMQECAEGYRRPAPAMVDMKLKKACAAAGITMFSNTDELQWSDGYGGEPWVMVCKTWFQLYNAANMSDATVYSDKMISIEHNTGSVLNKSLQFSHGGHDWIKPLLDLKFKANEPEQLIPYASVYVRKLATASLKTNYGRTWDTAKYGKHEPAPPHSEIQWTTYQIITDALKPLGYMYNNTSSGGDSFDILVSNLPSQTRFRIYLSVSDKVEASIADRFTGATVWSGRSSFDVNAVKRLTSKLLRELSRR